MQCRWKRIWKRGHGADLSKDRPSFSRQQSPSYMSAVYDRTVRTNSYNDFVMKIDVFTGTVRAYGGNADVPFSLQASGLLDPSQEAVDDILQAQMDTELPEMMSMALEFFENSCVASTLCAILLQSVDEASNQCGRMEVLLAGLPLSGEVLTFMQQQLLVEGLSEMVKARNPFAGSEASGMFADVAKRYGDMGLAVEARRKVVGRKVRAFRRWRVGCLTVVVAVVVGATVVAVVVATHMAVMMATVPFVAVAGAVVRSKSASGRSQSISTGANAVGREAGNARPSRGQSMSSRMYGADDVPRQGLQDDVERNRKLVEFGWTHREEAKCVQQVSKQLFRSHSHMVRQLANLHEQVVVCFLIINKARDVVLQEFSPSPHKTSCFW